MDSEARFIFRVVVVTLSAILLAVVGAMLIGLFHDKVDNKEIFTVVGPAFQTVIGAFVGILSGRALAKKD